MKVISKKPWVYVLFEDDGVWILTVMVRYGAAENDMSIILRDSEVSSIQSNEQCLDDLIKNINQNPSRYIDREIRPAVWPT